MNKRVHIADRSISDIANRADVLDIYTVQSEQRGTMYMWDGDHFGLYFYSAMLKMSLKEAKFMAKEMLDVIAEIEDLQRMEIVYKGLGHRGREAAKHAKQRKDNGMSILCEREK